MVAVNLKILPDKCRIYISKNSGWDDRDVEYINEIKGLMINLSKDAPMTFVEATKRKDVSALFFHILEYCSVKLENRLKKLKKDKRIIKTNHILNTFLEFLKLNINVDNLDEIHEYKMTTACCEYYNYNKNNKSYPQRFLGHIRKVGPYSASVMDI